MSKMTPRHGNQAGPFTSLIDQIKYSIENNKQIDSNEHIKEVSALKTFVLKSNLIVFLFFCSYSKNVNF